MPEPEGRHLENSGQEAARIRAHYELEKRWATQLRVATREERRKLVPIAYEEVARLVGRASVGEVSETRSRHVIGEMRLLGRFLGPGSTFCELGPGDYRMVLEVAKHVKLAYAVDIEREYSKAVEGRPTSRWCLPTGSAFPCRQAASMWPTATR